MSQPKDADIGVTGLAVMGRNLARNFARHGHVVALHNRSPERTRSLVSEHGGEGTFVPSESMADFVASLRRPRAIVVMVKAGAPTDAVIDELVPLLEQGDIVMDCGNAHYTDTRRREAALRDRGLHFVGCGVSGGEEGALNGPSIMPGGSTESYQRLGPMLEQIAAQVDGTPCCTHVGPDGAGHFVKMVHNGIEYADMQLIAEAYDLLRHCLGMTPAQIAETFKTWNTGRLDSYLIQITAEVLAHTDAGTGRPFVDIVIEQALYASKLVSYAQGWHMMAVGSGEYDWNLDLGQIAVIWRGGCIIRAAFLDRIRAAYENNAELPTLLTDEDFSKDLAAAQEAWRNVVATAVRLGIPVPGFSAALAYYDALRAERLPAALVQGLRDFFGAHTYRRTDRDGTFHTLWADDRSEQSR